MSSPVSIFLRDLRLQVGMTQLDLAHSIGYEQAYVSSIELGTKSPSHEFLAKLVIVMLLSAVNIAVALGSEMLQTGMQEVRKKIFR